MRTTLNISDDVLIAAKEAARLERRTIGDVLSAWARRSLLHPEYSLAEAHADEQLARRGIHPMPRRGGVLTNRIVNCMRDVEGI